MQKNPFHYICDTNFFSLECDPELIEIAKADTNFDSNKINLRTKKILDSVGLSLEVTWQAALLKSVGALSWHANILQAKIKDLKEINAYFAFANLWLMGTFMKKKEIKPNYSFYYHPTIHSENGHHDISLQLSSEFAEFAKTQTIDNDQYNKKIVEIYNTIFGRKNSSYFLKHNHFFDTDNGLLRFIQVPGERTCLYLEQNNDFKFISHNMDRPSQAAAVFLLSNYWLNDLESRLK